MKTIDELTTRSPATLDAPPVPDPAPLAPDAADAPPPLPRSRLLLAAAFAALSLAWMLGGIFEGSLARVLGAIAVVIGVATIGFAARVSAGQALEYLLVPVAFVAAAVASVALPNATGSTGTVPELVARAINNGGLLQPPVPYDPGWRFLTVFLVVAVAGALASVTLSSRRPSIVPALVVPLVFAAGLLQPRGSELASTLVSLAAIAASLMILYTAALAGEGRGNRFELRQSLRGGAAIVAVCVAIAALSSVDALFPETDRFLTPRPQKPAIVPLDAVQDRVLFTVDSAMPGPWRLGVLDTYEDATWLLPPVDPRRLDRIGSQSALAGAAAGGSTVSATFTVEGLEGLTLPAVANPVRVTAPTARIDRQTQVLRVTGSSAGRGFTYTVEGIAGPSADALRAATGPVPEPLRRYTDLPPAPPAVERLLAAAPRTPWERLQFLRARLYEKVVAAGSGLPIAIAPQRVGEMLAGADASPYEITAAEAMLARWAGIPARIGYGFYRGEQVGDRWEVRPRHGANWLEAWFPGLGWVPVVGVPPRARASLNADPKNRDVVTRPAEELTLQVYIPLKQQNPLLLYVVVRYWLAIVTPFILAALLLWAFLPALLKPIRSRRRRRWAVRRGPAEEIAVAYAEFRDAAHDLNAGDPYDTPLEYVERIADDEEHLEFAWLVTRSLWGDLARGLAREDVDAAIAMSASLRRRLARAQTPLTRLLSWTTRASLREPFDPSLPNVWPKTTLRGAVARAMRALRARMRPSAWRRARREVAA